MNGLRRAWIQTKRLLSSGVTTLFLCIFGQAADISTHKQAEILAPFTKVGPTAFHLDAQTSNLTAPSSRNVINATSYWIALSDFCSANQNLSLLPAGIRLSADGPTDIVETDKRWFSPVVIGNSPTPLATAGPIALQATQLHYFQGLNEQSDGMLAFNIFARFAPVLENDSRPQMIGISGLQWSSDVGKPTPAGGNAMLARELQFIPRDIAFAVDSLNSKATQVTLQGNVHYRHLKVHTFNLTYGKDSLINLPDNSGWIVKMTHSSNLNDQRQYLVFTPLSATETQWKISPDRDLQIYSRHGELVRFSDQTSTGANTIRIRLNISIKEGATIVGKVRSEPIEEQFPFHLQIPLHAP